MLYNWQQSDWPEFRHELDGLIDRLLAFSEHAGRVGGMLEGLPEDLGTEAVLDLMIAETIRSFAIEGGDPMQVVSCRIDRPTVHFEAPPSARVPSEMARFIRCFNDTAPGGPGAIPHPPVRSALAHLYFESIHPFEDGNGRISSRSSAACSTPAPRASKAA